MPEQQPNKYAQDGVDTDEGDSFSEFAGALCRSTYRNSRFVDIRDFSRAHFRGPRGFQLKNLPPGCWLDMAPDGDGTKVVLVDAASDYDNAAFGWIAMTCGDVSRWGGLPLVLVNNLDTETIGKKGQPVNIAFRSMMRGVKRIADREQLVMFKGETAELPGCVTSPNPHALAKYLWSGVCLGVYNEKTTITGDQIAEGMLVMACREPGLRNNGISSARKGIAMAFGPDWATNPEAQDAIKRAAMPSILYDKFLATVNGWFAPDFQPILTMRLIVHLTGGAIKSKFFEDILKPRGLSAKLDGLWEPAPIMRECAKWRGMTDEECYETWHGGQGILVVIDEADEPSFIDQGAIFGIEIKRAGKITKENTPRIVIDSKFNGETIQYPKPNPKPEQK